MKRYGNPDLDGSMNIFVKELSKNKTQIKINARYIFTHIDSSGRFIWSFNTGGCDSVNINCATITCKPTHVAEKKILHRCIIYDLTPYNRTIS